MNPSHPNLSVMLLAAGHGKRMLPLTENRPKPLLKVAGKSLLDHHLTQLNDAGFKHVVINVAYLGHQIIEHVQRHSYANLDIHISDEQDTGALETAGGIAKAISVLHSDPFLVINSDVWHNVDLVAFCARAESALNKADAYLGLVKNPPHNDSGDFVLHNNGEVQTIESGSQTHALTFSGLGVYKKSLFSELGAGAHKLAPLLVQCMARNAVYGEQLDAQWFDIGTPQRLADLETKLTTA